MRTLTVKHIFIGLFCVSIVILLLFIHPSTPPARGILGVSGSGIVDLGKFPADQGRELEFKLSNTGNSDLTLRKIKKDCLCLITTVNKRTIEPGSEATLYVRLRANSTSGDFCYNIRVYCDQSSSPLTLTLSGKAVPFINVQPSAHMYIGHILPQHIIKKEFILKAPQNGVRLGAPVIFGAGKEHCSCELIPDGEKQWRLALVFSGGKTGRPIDLRVKVPVLEPPGQAPIRLNIKGWRGLQMRCSPSIISIPARIPDNYELTFSLKISGDKAPDPAKFSFPEIPGISFSCRKQQNNVFTVSVRFTPGEMKLPPPRLFNIKINYPDSTPGIVTFKIDDEISPLIN